MRVDMTLQSDTILKFTAINLTNGTIESPIY
jgi:hypothetical protein